MDEQQVQPQIDKLAAALAKAQAEFPAAPKSGKNPFLKNEYATLDDIIGAVRKPLGAHGLSFVQLLATNGGLTLRTVLLHESGQSLESTVSIGDSGPEKGINTLQSMGKAITYMKRYTLAAMLGVATGGDTDGEGAPEGAGKQKQRTAQAPAPDSNRPLPPDKLLPGLRRKAGWHKIGADYKRDLDAVPVPEKQRGLVTGRIEGLFPNLKGGLRTKARYEVMGYLFGFTSTHDLTKAEASALIDWTEDTDAATQEAAQIIEAVALEAGQQKMALDAEAVVSEAAAEMEF